MKPMLRTLYITTEDVYLSLKDENVVVSNQDETLAKIPLRTLDHILCFSYKGASPALMGKCAEFGVSLSFYSPRGHYHCQILGENNRNVFLRRAQYRIADSETQALPLAKSFIFGKIHNCRWSMERTKRDHALRVNADRLAEHSRKLAGHAKQAGRCASMSELRGLEGLAAQQYFHVFDDMILNNKENFYFNERTRRPPQDNMNALLSFLYALLTRDCSAALQGVGLDPYVGFMHTDRPGRESLALDLMEELRPIIADRLALTMVNTGMVNEKHFTVQENGSVLLNDEGRRTVLKTWQKRKEENLTHPFLEEKLSWGMVPYSQALLLARTIRGDTDAYPPFLWK